MLVFQYLDHLPPIPPELLINFWHCDAHSVAFTTGIYTRYRIRSDLEQWIHTNISRVDQRVGCQVLQEDIAPHCDFRAWAVNYLVTTGGSGARTRIHCIPGQSIQQSARRSLSPDESTIIVESLDIEPFRWHLLNTHVLHSVTGIAQTRSAVTVGLTSPNPFQDLVTTGTQ